MGYRTGEWYTPREEIWFMGPWSTGSMPSRELTASGVVEEASRTTPRYSLSAPGCLQHLKEGSHLSLRLCWLLTLTRSCPSLPE